MIQQNKQEVWIKDEVTGASFIREELIIPKEIIEKVASKQILNRLESLENQVKILKTNKEVIVPDNQAKEIVLKTLNDFKLAGISEIDIIDLHNQTKLPITQINEIMIEFEDEGKVKEHGESNQS